MTETTSSVAKAFTFVRSGPLSWLVSRLGLRMTARQLVARAAWAAVLVTWLPLFVLSLVQGQAYGHGLTIPFIKDLAVNVRFLVALPILFMAENRVDERWKLVVREFLGGRLVSDADVPKFEALLLRIERLASQVWPGVALLVIAFVPSAFIKTELLMHDVSSWHTVGPEPSPLSPAGWWFSFVCTPVYRFLLLRWIWRLLLVAILMWRVSRMQLALVPSHADLAAGLGFLAHGQKAFAPVIFAGGVAVAAQVANAIAHQGATLASMRVPMLGYGVFAIVLLIAPLLVVTPVLMRVKAKALLEYGRLVTLHNQDFDRKWIYGGADADASMLGDSSPCSMIDLGSSYTVITRMSLVPLDRHALLFLALAATLPMVPVVLWATPADKLLAVVIKMLG
jgi:hypothetical protein